MISKKFIKNSRKYFVFFSFLIIGLLIYKDYGFNIDEKFQVDFRDVGQGETRILNNQAKILPNWQPAISLKAGLMDYLLDTHEYNV